MGTNRAVGKYCPDAFRVWLYAGHMQWEQAMLRTGHDAPAWQSCGAIASNADFASAFRQGVLRAVQHSGAMASIKHIFAKIVSAA